MDIRKVIAYVLLALAGLGAMYLLAGKQATVPGPTDITLTPPPCSDQPVIAGLPNAQSPQLRRLAAYQALCESAVPVQLIVPAGIQPSAEFASFGLQTLSMPDMPEPQPITIGDILWLPAVTDATNSPTRRNQLLQATTDQALRLQKEGTHVGIYILAEGEHSYFNGSEQVLRDFIARWHKAGLPIALYDRG